jgi:serine/threonine protein kinase
MEKSKPQRIGRFKLVRQLGKGSQGIVYLATDPTLQRQVAIKALRVKSPGARAPQTNFLQEARTVSKLQHPNIVPIFEAGEHHGIPFLVFEYVDGISLKEIIEKKDVLTISRAVGLMRHILNGVGHAHQQGIVHRDLKPANILVSKSGVPRVMDFGLSQIVGSNKTNKDTGHNLDGTLRYMSPEHFSETPIGPGSDVFALGLIFYEMLTLTPAITGKTQVNFIHKIAFEPTVAPSLLNPKLDGGLDSIVLKAVQKEINARFPDANSMKEALDEYIDMKKRGLQARSGNIEIHSTIDFLLRRMRYKTDFPAFSESVMEINRMTSSTSKASAKELANVILKDFSLTSKLLKLVNSTFYGQAGGSVTSIYKTVVILGFEQVRLASSSLMLFTHLRGKSATNELRDAMIRSFLSGIITRDLTTRAQTGHTEVAFICSMFHDLGKNLAIYYFPEEYAEIKILMAENGQDIQSAARSVLGISLNELGVAVARAWKFPENIVYCMRGLPSGAVEKPKSTLDYLRHFSVFANELCGLVSGGLPENRGEPLSRLVQRFEQSIDISETEVLTLLQSQIKGVLKYTAILDIDPDQSPFIQSLLEFIGTDDGPDVTKVFENQPPQSSESGDVENLPIKDGVKESKGSDRTKQSHSISNSRFSALPMRIWQRFLKLVQK